jgi:AdoMet-dependent heme synthase
MLAEGMDEETIATTSVGRGFGIRDGNGIMFVATTGRAPVRVPPVRTGNVRTDDLVDLYRTHPVFTSLRDVTTYKGRCGRCEYARLCGGSRARAYAWTGDFLDSDPLCP